MTADRTGRLVGRQAHPSAIVLGPGPDPAALIALLNPVDHPAVLWGRWFGGGVVVMRSPLRTMTAATVGDVLALIDDQPTVADDAVERSHPVAVIGGGWLSCLGFTPGVSAACFYDSLLRWQPTSGWTFETLGLAGREGDVSAELQAWRGLMHSTVAKTAPTVSAARFTTPSPPASTRLSYLASIDAAIGRIHAGEFYQLNLCTRLVSSSADSAPEVFAQLATQLDPAYGGLLITRLGDQQVGIPTRAVVSMSPELFLQVRGSTVTSQPIKGTAIRAPGDADSPLLRASAKDAAENIMIVDLMRNDLSQVCRPGTVTVDDLLELQAHPGLWHLVSTVSGQLTDGVTTGRLLGATFPPGSVSGAPKYSALAGIADLEPLARGSYTGTLGFSSPLAGADFNVLIRTLECSNNQIELGVGGGITVDSVAIKEWDECLAKAAPLVAALGSDLDPELQPSPPLVSDWQRSGGLLETMLAIGSSVRRLAAHLARLDRSCRELYGEGLPDDLAGQITTAVTAVDTGSVARRVVRLVVRPEVAGLAFDVSVAALGPRPSGSRLTLAARSVRCWRHKWADRRELERAEQEQGGHLPYFLTPAEQVAETSRGNLFCQRSDGVWLTPPLDDNLLPGVTRREVLDLFVRATIPFSIEFFSAQTLRQSAAAFWTSSLSGAVPVTAVDGFQLSEPQAVVAMLNAGLGID
ncbi:MAG TPA: chorismate-binding protein [Propionibacteriaceae bacterium]|nr:chorismate-binding protein [Propionibacteriaceae bacterium]